MARLRAILAAAAALGIPVAALALTGALAPASPSLSAAAVTTASGEPTPSHLCGNCHRDIYRMWRNSAHAIAMEDPVFLEALRDTEAREKPEVRRTCLGCHAPLAEVTRDLALASKITWEGVGCDYCHSIIEVKETDSRVEAVVRISTVKRGPIQDAASTAHDVAYSPLHETSPVCAPCHQYVNGEGTVIMSTYSEWKASKAAEDGVSCQSCHMGLTKANVVDPRVQRVERAQVNLHEVPGGHSLEQLHRALGVALAPERQGDELALRIALTNRGAGHAVPTGMPGRRVILEVSLETGEGKSFRETRTYERSFLDAAGKPIVRDSGFFASGVKPGPDTRIQADERRIETFRFPLPARVTAYLAVRLHYEHAPRGTEEDRTFLTFVSEKRVIRPEAEPNG